jgi:hypothetical protein
MVARAEAAGITRAYKLGEVPKSPSGSYVVLSLDSGTPSTYDLTGSSDSMRQLAVQIFGDSPAGLDDLTARTDTAFRDVYLTELPDSPRCNRVLATRPSRDPDGEVLLYVLHVYQWGES